MPKDILESLGNIPDNEITLPLLVQQLHTPVGVVPFIGAGMSAPLGFPQWTVFLRGAAKLAGVTRAINKRIAASEYEEAAEDLIAALTPKAFQDLIETSFGDQVFEGKALTGAITLVPRLSSGPVITTNFDRVLERVFENEGYPFDSVVGHSRLDLGVRALERNDQTLLKLHGDWEDPDNRILTLTEYRTHYWDPNASAAAGAPLPKLFTLLGIKPLLFLGCTLTADRTIKTLQHVGEELKSSRHYAVVQRPKSVAKFRARKQFLATHNIRPVWYPEGEHDRIEPLLRYLGDQVPESYRRKNRRSELPETTRDALPTLLTRFVGRQRELVELRDRALHARLLTLAGAPAMGKRVLRSSSPGWSNRISRAHGSSSCRRCRTRIWLPNALRRRSGSASRRVVRPPSRSPHSFAITST